MNPSTDSIDMNNPNTSERSRYPRRRKRSSGILLAGATFFAIGGLLLARELGADIPHWIFRWEMLVILFGLNVLIRSRGRDLGGFIVLGVGLFFLSGEIWPEFNTGRFAFPVIVLTIGLLIILTARFPGFNKFRRNNDLSEVDDDVNSGYRSEANHNSQASDINEFRSGNEAQKNDAGQLIQSPQTHNIKQPNTHQYLREEKLEIVSVFSGNNKKVYTKNFLGGEVVCVFGGSEIELMNADITEGPIELEVVCIFGGATLFMPPNWLVRSEMASVFGGVDDKRRNIAPDPDKVITIKGVCIFGGLEIKSRVY